MSSTRQKLEAVWMELTKKAQDWLLSGRITIKEARLLSRCEGLIDPEHGEILDRLRLRAVYVSGMRVGCEDISSFDTLVHDVLIWEEINPFATEVFLEGDFTLEQMRMAACLRMGRRSARMFSQVNYPELVQERRDLSRVRRKLHAQQRLHERKQRRGGWPSYSTGGVWCPV